MTLRRYITIQFLSVSIGILPVFSSEPASEVFISRLEGQIIFDGMPDEPAWQKIDPFPMVMHRPVFGNEPSERTDVRVTYDEDYVYIGASFYAEDPSLIQSASKKRDAIGTSSDWLGVMFDTYNDNENGLNFWTNPSGLRADMAVYNDAVPKSQNTPSMNTSWNTHWDVETQLAEDGWYIEMRIPVSSLRFQDVDGEASMGMTLTRWVPYLNEVYTYPAIPDDYGDWGTMKPSMAQNVIFRDLKSRKPLYIAPYVIGGFTQINELNDAETDYEYRREDKIDAGLDLKYGISSNLVLDVTVNTDFAQVEADDERVNLTRFSLYFPEKRQFFLENASLFDFQTGGRGTMFYSRRIGLDEDSNPVPIYGGVRLTGRQGPWDIGFLNMQTAISDSLPSENFGVLRLKRRIINNNSYMGGILTSRIGRDGSFNEAYGIDALIRVKGDEYLKLIWGQTFENELENKAFTLKNARYLINWIRRKRVGFFYDIFLEGTGIDFDPGIGFQSRDDYHSLGALVDYIWLLGEASPIRSHGPGLTSFSYVNQSRGVIETLRNNLSYNLRLKSNWSFFASAGHMYENVFELFEISDDAEVPVGEYNYPEFRATITSSTTKRAWAYLSFNGGGYFDGTRISVSLKPSWSLTSSFVIGGTYTFNRIDFATRNQRFQGHIGQFKAEYMFSTKLSASAYIQYNSAVDRITSNFRFRYNPREGNDLYLVYNEGANTDLEREVPHAPRLGERTLQLKYTYTFRL